MGGCRDDDVRMLVALNKGWGVAWCAYLTAYGQVEHLSRWVYVC
jgi:hypothetical protein